MNKKRKKIRKKELAEIKKNARYQITINLNSENLKRT